MQNSDFERTPNNKKITSLTLRPSRWKTLFFLLVSLAAVASGVFILEKKYPNQFIAYLIGYSAILFFGLGMVIAIVQLLFSFPYLYLDYEGFTVGILFRKYRRSWMDIELFFVRRTINHKLGVVWNYKQSCTRAKQARALNRSSKGYEAFLPNNFGKTSEELVAIMNQFRSACDSDH